MKKNVGSTDKIVRLTAAAVITLLILTGVLQGTMALVLGLAAVVFVATSLINFCPLYAIFGLTTKKLKNDTQH